MIDRNAPGLYVHVPFCVTKCPYCDFYSTTEVASIPRWLASLRREIDLYNETFPYFDTLYIGGGTPSVLGERDIELLMTSITGAFDIAAGAEITIELNPGDATPQILSVYRDVGINRISLGVQSFNDDELRFLGRRHDARIALRAVENIRRSGFYNIGIDLLYGFEEQTIARWERTLHRALELVPEHLSCYQLTIEPGTQFGEMRAAGALGMSEDDTQREFFIRTSGLLRSHGYIHYEISNFSREEHLVSRHNSKYWRHAPYLGLGPAAHSFDGKRRWWNARCVNGYCRALETGDTPVGGSELLLPEQIALEKLSLGFRTNEGVDLSRISKSRDTRSTLRRLEEESFIELAGGRAIPTTEGFLVADKLPLLF